MPIQEKQRLRAYFAQHKNIPLSKFSQIIRGDRKVGQKRGRGENPFNIRQGRYYDGAGIEQNSSQDWDAESVFTSLSDF